MGYELNLDTGEEVFVKDEQTPKYELNLDTGQETLLGDSVPNSSSPFGLSTSDVSSFGSNLFDPVITGAKALGTSVAQGIGDATTGALGLGKAFSETTGLGTDTVLPAIEGMLDEERQTQQERQNYLDSLDLGMPAKAGLGAVRGVTSFAPTMALGGSGLLGQAALQGSIATGQKYEDLRQNGTPVNDALAGAAVTGAAQGALSTIPLGVARDVSLVRALAYGVPVGAATGAGNQAASYVGDYVANGTPGLPSGNNMLSSLGESALTGAAMGAVLPLGTRAVDSFGKPTPLSATGSRQELQPIVDAMKQEGAVLREALPAPDAQQSLPAPEVQQALPAPDPVVGPDGVTELTVRPQKPTETTEPIYKQEPQPIDLLDDVYTPKNPINLVKNDFVVTNNALGTIDKIKEVAGKLDNKITFPKTIAEKQPLFSPIFEKSIEKDKVSYRINNELQQLAKPYFDLPDKTNVNKLLAAARYAGKDFVPSLENLQKFGATADEANAFLAAQKTTKKAIEVLDTSLREKGKYLPSIEEQKTYNQNVDTFMQELYDSNYMPFGRQGDVAVTAKDGTTGEVLEVMFVSNKAQVLEASNMLRQRYFNDLPEGQFSANGRNIQVEANTIKKPSDEYLSHLPLNMSLALGKLSDPDGMKASLESLGLNNFQTKHFTKAELVNGYNPNLEESLADYIQGISYYAAHKMTEPAMVNQLDHIYKTQGDSSLFQYSKKYIDNMRKGDPEWSKATRQYIATINLGGNVKTALINSSQTLTTTIPTAARYTKNPIGEVALATKSAAQYKLNPKSLAKSNPDLFASLEEANASGILGSNLEYDLRGIARGGKTQMIDKLQAASGLFNELAEKQNRLIAFTTGHNLAAKQGLVGPERFKFAEKFVQDTQFTTSKANRPEIAQGAMAPAFLYRLYGGNMFKLMRDNFAKSKLGTAGVMQVGALIALGGVQSLPFVREIQKGFESKGEDPVGYVRSKVGQGKAGDAFMYGLPTLAGKDISGSMSSEFIADGMGVSDILAKTALGPAYQMYERPKRAFEMMSGINANPLRASEPLMPDAVKNAVTKFRSTQEGYRNYKGELIANNDPNQSMLSQGLSYLGVKDFAPTKGYEKNRRVELLTQEVKDKPSLNKEYAQALLNNDSQAINQILAKRDRYNAANPNNPIILSKRAVKDWQLRLSDIDKAKVKKAPKGSRAEMKDIIREYD